MADGNGQQDGLAAAIAAVSDRATMLVREEIQLAKAEIQTKLEKLARGIAVAIAAGIFVVVGLLYLLDAFAWGSWQAFFGGNNYWAGFLLVAVVLFILGSIAGILAYRWLKTSSPPAPTMAIDEARLIKETVVQASDEELQPKL